MSVRSKSKTRSKGAKLTPTVVKRVVLTRAKNGIVVTADYTNTYEETQHVFVDADRATMHTCALLDELWNSGLGK